MIGALTAGKKAATYGYKKYGVPGAVVAGAGGAVGIVAAKKGVKAVARSAADDLDSDADGRSEPDGFDSEADGDQSDAAR